MLLSRRELDRISGQGTSVVYRRWRRPSVRAGGRLRTAIGVLAIEALELVSPESITPTDAAAAGFGSLAELHSHLAAPDAGETYRIVLRLRGEDPRIALRQEADLSEAAVADLRRRLERLDARGAWTRSTLLAIAARSAERAEVLAQAVGQDKLAFKRNVRKLKELGLTESLTVGYRLSPRGEALLRLL